MTAPKKKNVVLRVVLVILALFAAVCALGLYAMIRWYNDPATQETLGAAKSAMRLTIEASKAPGTKALREAGCHQSAVFSGEQAKQYFSTIGQLTKEGGEEEIALPFVMCGVRPDKPLTCETIVQTYVASVEAPPEEMLVMVQAQSIPQRSLCAGVYDRSGKLIEAIDLSAQ